MVNLTLIKDTLLRLQLHHMDMSTMNFTDLFQTYPLLDTLEMDGCKVASWPDFSAAHKLKYINLNWNKITSYPPTLGFPTDNVLQTLHISGNKAPNVLTSISSFFEGLPNLIQLGMSSVDATTWPNVSGYIHNLRLLHVASNPLNGIDTQLFLGVDNLTSPELPPEGYPLFTDLNLNSIRLTYFPEELLTIFPNLRYLRLGYNQGYISNVPNFTLIYSTLYVLEIQYNDNGQGEPSPYPTFHYETVLHNMIKLNYLYMHRNFIPNSPFSAEFIIQQFPALRYLILEDNLIQTLQDLTPVGNAPHHDDLEVQVFMLPISNYSEDIVFPRKTYLAINVT